MDRDRPPGWYAPPVPVRQDDGMDLVEFLRARLDDDERDALAASPGPWSPNAEADEVTAADGITVCDGFALSNNQLRATVRHIARHDPARVLAEVEAKRRIIRDYEQDVFHSTDVLRILAAVFADHPNYNPMWRP